MRLHLCRTIAAAALIVLNGAAFADVTVSQSNDPSVLMGSQIASLFEAEHDAVNALPQAELTALAIGPQAPVKKRAGDPGAVQYTDEFLASLPVPAGDEQWDCLRKALYFEARGESMMGEFAVAEVILNRVDSPDYPKSVCNVVHASGGGACAFSYVCDGVRDVMHEPGAADRAGRIARVMLDGATRSLTQGATYFHTRHVRPDWGDVVQTAAIGDHLFFRGPTVRTQ
ncbi:MAG: cell wall hydrolase [Paracoccaceae bacterium]